MGKLNMFEIYLDRTQPVFSSGETLKGHAVVELGDKMKMRGIRLQFLGHADVHWSEQHSSGSGKNRQTRTVHYRSNESYFNTTVTVYGKAPGQSGDDPELETGRYDFPFEFKLPDNLPSSFEGVYGRVRYSIKGIIDRPWRFDHTTKRPFSVLSVLDLNQQPNVREPRYSSDHKTLCCLCCKSGPISATFSIDRTGYVPGEYVAIMGEADNKSNRNMKNSKIVLTQLTAFHARGKSRTTTTQVTQLYKDAIPPGGSETWNGERLHIPAIPPSCLSNCRIIDITYVLSMIVEPAGPAFSLAVPIELTIGTVPLQNMFQPWSQGQTGGSNYPAPPNQTQGAGGVVAPPNVPPPSYADCVFGKADIHEEDDTQYTRGDMNWAPVYTYYTWDTPNPDQNPAAPPTTNLYQ